MTWIIEGNPLDLRDFVEERLDHEVLGDTFVAIGDECWDTNEVQMIDNRPILQDARKENECKYGKLLNTYGAEETVGSPSELNTWSKVYQYSAGIGRMAHPWTEWILWGHTSGPLRVCVANSGYRLANIM